jgi:hypothetical protein
MTNAHSAATGTRTHGPASRRLARLALLLGTPVLLGAALWFHPAGTGQIYDSIAPIADRWLAYHALLLPLFGLLGCCLYVLLDEYDGPAGRLGRVGVAVYFVCYVAFEAVAGIATGLVARGAQGLPEAQQAGVAAALQATMAPILVLAVAGTAGALLAVGALVLRLRRDGAPAAPVALLFGAPLTAFGHGGAKLDVLGMALFLAGVAWLELRWTRPADAATARVDGA